MGVFVRGKLENQPKNKHVESIFVTCLDGGSTPPSSTKSRPSDGGIFFVFRFHRDGIEKLEGENMEYLKKLIASNIDQNFLTISCISQ